MEALYGALWDMVSYCRHEIHVRIFGQTLNAGVSICKFRTTKSLMMLSTAVICGLVNEVGPRHVCTRM